MKHVIWDWNGTLLNDVEAGLNAINAMLDTRRLPLLTMDVYREIFGFPVRQFYEKAGFTLERENWDSIAHEFHAHFLADSTLRLQDGAATVLAALKRRGIGQSVLSVSQQSILTKMLDGFGISAFFDEIRGVDNLYGISKVELGEQLLGELALPPPEILMVGDTLHDAEVARALGLSCVLIAQGHQSFHRLASSGFPVLHQLQDILQMSEDSRLSGEQP
jgi:phosphoglycolate phosphatase